MLPIVTHRVITEQDVVTARQRARSIAEHMGFEAQDQTRIATGVSEIVRNALRYAAGATVTFSLYDANDQQGLSVNVVDKGPGIADLDRVLSGRYTSRTGMGIGIIGTQRLMDAFDISSSHNGTQVNFTKLLPKRLRRIGTSEIQEITKHLTQEVTGDPLREIQQQNQELLRTLEELKRSQEELRELNRELEDTNRGVVALYAELDERADHLRRADEIKSRFLSNMSHEFRTPVNSIIALSRLLLNRTDGDLTSEQEIQINFIRKAASDLGELVNDLLDLAKVEAGKIELHPIDFSIENLFGALRGMLRPLLLNESVALVIDEATNLPPLYTDEPKVSQILRNLISNALKFTERGEVRVTARLSQSGESVIFEVSDTGLGIAPEHHETIFQEFAQVDSAQQRRVKGTGLGLPLSRKLAELLGGTLTVESSIGHGSRFTVILPVRLGATVAPTPLFATPDADEMSIVLLEDRAEETLIYESYLRETPYRLYPTRTIKEAREAIETVHPSVVVLDILLKGEEGWSLLRDLKHGPHRTIPVLVVTDVEDRGRALALGADAFYAKPVEPGELLATLTRLMHASARNHALIIDDEQVSRYLMRQLLEDLEFHVSEVDNGSLGIERAMEEHPDIILLDLVMPGMNGLDVLKRLSTAAETRDIPVIISSSKTLTDSERETIARYGARFLPKEITTHDMALAALDKILAEAGLRSSSESSLPTTPPNSTDTISK